jgi:hypothetical protein
MLQVLANHGLVREITHNNTKRFLFDEGFVRYLRATSKPSAGSPAPGSG